MEWRGVVHSLHFKTSTKFIIVTCFSSEKLYKAGDMKHDIQIRNFMKFPTYVNAMAVDVIGDKVEVSIFINC